MLDLFILAISASRPIVSPVLSITPLCVLRCKDGCLTLVPALPKLPYRNCLSPPLAVIIKPHLQKILLPISLPLSLPLSLSSISNPTLPLRLLPLVRKPRLSWISLSLCSVVFLLFFPVQKSSWDQVTFSSFSFLLPWLSLDYRVKS